MWKNVNLLYSITVYHYSVSRPLYKYFNGISFYSCKVLLVENQNVLFMVCFHLTVNESFRYPYFFIL